MKRVVFLLLCILLVSSCKNKSSSVDSLDKIDVEYDILNVVIRDAKGEIGKDIYTTKDTFKIKNFLMDPVFYSGIIVDSSQGLKYPFKFREIEDDSLYIGLFFAKEELPMVVNQMTKHSGDTIKSYLLDNPLFRSKSYYNQGREKYPKIWYEEIDEYDYLILTHPIFNGDTTIAVVATECITQNGAIRRFYKLSKNKDSWRIDLRYSAFINFVEDAIEGGKLRLYRIYSGTEVIEGDFTKIF